jgi:hypothetical protein
MPVDVGTARVIISGDYSKLAADFSAANSIAATSSRAIGNSVSSAFGSSSLLVDQFGRAIQSSTAEVAAALPPVLDLEAGIQRLAFANAILAQQMEAVSSAAQHQVTQVQAASAAIRVGLGEQSIRAVERLLTMIPGVGVALQAAFPVLGALALVSAIHRVAEEATGLKAAEEELARQTQQTDSAFQRVAAQIERTNVQLQALQFGAAAGTRLQRIYDAQSATADSNAIADLQQKIRELAELEGNIANHPLLLMPYFGNQAAQATVDKIRALGEQIAAVEREHDAKGKQLELDAANVAKETAQEQARITLARLAAQESALSHEAEISSRVAEIQITQGHAVAQAQINAMHDVTSAAVSSAAEEVRVAEQRERMVTDIIARETLQRIALVRSQGAAESAGKNDKEQGAIGVQTAGKVSDVLAEAAQKQMGLQEAVAAAKARLDEADATRTRKLAADAAKSWEEAYDAITKAGKQTENELTKAVEGHITAQAKSLAIEAKGEGQVAALGVQAQKLQLERQYGIEVSHTLAQEVTYRQQIADFDKEARAKQIEGLQNELAIARTIADEDDKKSQVARIQAEINDLTAKGNNAEYEAQTKILELIKQKSVNGKLQQEFQRIPSSVGQSAAQGVVDGKHIGQDIKNSLVGIGKQMLGDVFEKLIAQLLITTGIQTLFNAIFPVATSAQVIATTANTVALGILTDVMIVQAALFGFASGGRPAPGVPYVVGENGPEIRVDDAPGTIIPNGAFSLPSSQDSPSAVSLGGGGSSVTSQAFNFGGDMHFHGVQNVRDLMREIATISKNSSPSRSPYNN